ncbi:TIGR02679 family protein [Modestobacter sp. Leaf380]|uniref:TIGR02679 family protein n=1 Tax=Modestobacter sp. Leaf380 TaxID=1736356 RepID=UPI0006FF4619|nr:TIGR02679 family protein [Modestobacter sp. Leaf380]KQS69267.1 hypothetical protein ASG41_21885 [Modestobacter sp. Leaf380]
MSLLDELGDAALAGVWRAVRRQLETTGLQPSGAVTVQVDGVAADLLGGLLGRRPQVGRWRIGLADLDAALRASPAAVSLVEATVVLHGPLRDRPAERRAAETARIAAGGVWAESLVAAGLPAEPWVVDWTAGLRTTGLLGSSPASLQAAVSAVATVLADPRPRTLGELAAAVTGDAHGLDPGRRAGAVALRGLAARSGQPPPGQADARSRLWASVGVAVDDVSGTVLVLNWRPPSKDRWAVTMRERADLGLPTHVTVRELRTAPGPWALPGHVVHACENPQVLQAAADRRLPGALVCLQGNPSAAAALLVQGLASAGAVVRYHGDFDWPGVAIAGRVFALGAAPWRFGAADYLDVAPALGVPLTGRRTPTPWDPGLAEAMQSQGSAVHEEAVLEELLSDLVL